MASLPLEEAARILESLGYDTLLDRALSARREEVNQVFTVAMDQSGRVRLGRTITLESAQHTYHLAGRPCAVVSERALTLSTFLETVGDLAAVVADWEQIPIE